MRHSRIYNGVWLLLLGVFTIAHAALTPSSAPAQKPVDFVKSFYVALDVAETDTSLGRTEKLKNFLDDKLYQLQLKDDDIRANNEEQVVCGFLPFDAFVNDRKNRGAANHFAVVKNSKPLLVSVGFLDNEGPALYVQLIPVKGSWKIADFLYPDPDPKVDGKKSMVALLQKAQAQHCKKTVKPETADS
jgi:hypothetical protein